MLIYVIFGLEKQNILLNPVESYAICYVNRIFSEIVQILKNFVLPTFDLK